MKEEASCGNCKFIYSAGDYEAHWCHRYPPAVNLAGHGIHPHVTNVHWCGEHKFKHPKKKIKAINYGGHHPLPTGRPQGQPPRKP